MRHIYKIVIVMLIMFSTSAHAVREYYSAGYNWTTYYSSSMSSLANGQASWMCGNRASSVETLDIYNVTYWNYTCTDGFAGQGFATVNMCPEGESYNDEEQTCGVEPPPPPPPPPDDCPEGQYMSDNYQQCVPNCESGTFLNANMACVPANDCPSESPPACGGSTPNPGVQLTSDAACIAGCVAQWAGTCMSENPTSSEAQNSYYQGGYYYTGADCSGDGAGDGQGEGCRDDQGNPIACGENPSNDDPETTEEEKPPPDDTPDPNKDGHGDDGGEGEEEKPPEEKVDCSTLSEYYWDSSDGITSPPPSVYDDCPEKVHDTAPPEPEPVECSSLSTWYWNSSIPFSEPPPPEYADCPSKVVDFNEDEGEEEGICGDDGDFCDTHFKDGQGDICEKPPVCIEEDNFQCVSLAIQWEQVCQYALEDKFKNLTGDSASLGDSDAAYFDNPNVTSIVDVSTALDSSGWGLTRTCPSPPTITFMGTTFDVDNLDFCTMLGYIGNIIVLLSLLAAGRMVLS